jgi:hypothetical protein
MARGDSSTVGEMLALNATLRDEWASVAETIEGRESGSPATGLGFFQLLGSPSLRGLDSVYTDFKVMYIRNASARVAASGPRRIPVHVTWSRADGP